MHAVLTVAENTVTLELFPQIEADVALEQLASAPQTIDAVAPASAAKELPQPATWQLAVKRTLDIVVAMTASIVLLPVALLIAVLVKVTMPGPVFFRQERVGKGGEIFEVVKFRTMLVDAEERLRRDSEVYARYTASDFKLDGDDPRITKLGRFLRKSSLDELPQLLNVLVGTMSLVGIRPVEFPQFEQRPPTTKAAYVAMRPGITGLWQVSGRSSITGSARDALDETYVQSWSLRIDFKILVLTPIAVVRVHHSQ